MKKGQKMGKTCGKLAIFGEKVLKNCGFRGDVGDINVTNIVDENSGWKLSLIPELDIRPKEHRLVIETASKCLIAQNKRMLLAIILAQRLTRFNRGLKINSGRSKADRVAVAKKAANSRWGNR